MSFGQLRSQSSFFHLFGFLPYLHLKTPARYSTDIALLEGVGGPGERGLGCLVLTTFQPGEEGGEELDVCAVGGCDCVQVEGGREEDMDLTVDDNGVLVKEVESVMFDGGGTQELRTTWWALAGRSSLLARVTSMMSAATWLPMLDEGGSDLFFRNSALRLAFLLIAEGLFLFPASAAGSKLSLVSREKTKVEPIVSEKVKDLFWLASAWQKSMHLEAKEESMIAIFLFNLNQEN